MKNLIIYSSLVLTLLLQSCYSYREINIDQNLTNGKKYKIKQINKFEKIVLLSSTDSTITFINNNSIKNIKAKKDVKIIKKRKFSVTKTILLPIGIGIGIIGIGATIAFW